MEYMYAALLLHKLGKPVDEANLTKVVSGAGAEVDESKVKTLVASLDGVDIDAELANASVVAAAPVVGAEGGDNKAEEKKEEKAEEAAEGLSSLFG